MRIDYIVSPPADADPGLMGSDAPLQRELPAKTTVIRDGDKTVTIATDRNGHTTVTRTTGGAPDALQVPPLPGMPVQPGFPISDENLARMSRHAESIAYGFFTMCAVIIVGYPLARAFGRRIERRGSTAPLHPAAAEQLQRIEQGMEAMAIEIERISESQRFLAKLQSGQSAKRV